MRYELLLSMTAMMVLCTACAERVQPAPTNGQDESAAEVAAAPAPAPATQPSVEGTAIDRPAAATAPNAMVQLSRGSPSYLVDANGASLYFLEGNTDGTRCDATCERAWPPAMGAHADAGPGIAAGMIGALPRADGRSQLTYSRQPLYRYAGDAGAGRTSGHQVQDRSGRWSLLSPNGKALAHEPAPDNQAERTPPAADNPAQ
jgi:predicted lipoprotein with Yx(FWY)xxD motif